MMVRTSLVAGLALGLATVLASGALVRADGGAKAFSAPDQTSITTDSDINRMANVLRRGFRAIHDQALEPHTYSDLALAALSGLSTIDPALSVTTEDGIALVRVDGEAILGAALPEVEQDQVWSSLVAKVAQEVRDHRATLAAVDLETMNKAILDAVLDGFDIHSRYNSPDEADRHRSRRNGFSGIGVRYVRDGDAIRIREVMDKGPADGLLRVGDLITNIDGQAVADLEVAEMSSLLRGPRNTKVTLTVARDEGLFQEVVVVRDRVIPKSVDAEVRGDVVVVRIRRFNIATAQSVRDAVRGCDAVGHDACGRCSGFARQPGRAAGSSLCGRRPVPGGWRHRDHARATSGQPAIL